MMKRFFFLMGAIGCTMQLLAQDMPFNDGEELNFTVNYKYGMVNIKGGSAQYRTDNATYNDQSVMRTALTFKTTSFFDKIVMNMRDTLLSYTSLPALKPLFHYRSIYEGNHHYVEDMYIQKHGVGYTETLVKKTKSSGEVIETVTQATNAGYDFLNLFVQIRLAALSMQTGEVRNMSALMGEKVIEMKIHYVEKTIVNLNDADWFTIDIIDSKSFSTSKNAMEVWISDDDNHVILKLKAKLKIGAAEATLTSYKNLRDGSKRYK